MSSGSYFRRIADDACTGLPSIHRNLDVDRHVRFGNAPTLQRAREESTSIYRYRPESPSASRRHSELQDQIRLLRDDVGKKDALISQLSSLSGSGASLNGGLSGGRGVDAFKVEALMNVDRHLAESAKGEVAALSVKVEHLQKQLREAANELDSRDNEMCALKTENTELKEIDARNRALVQSLQGHVYSFEAKAGSLEGTANRSEFTITTLQRENNEAKSRILELEGRVRTHLEERENAEQQMNIWQKKYNDLVSQFSSILRIDEITGFVPASVDTLVSKVSEIVQENALVKGKMIVLREALENTEYETKASRETIMRLISETSRDQQTHSHYRYENRSLERDNAMVGKRDLEREVDLLNERLLSTQRALRNAQDELENRDRNLSSIDRELRDKDYRARDSMTQLSLFKEQLVSILGDRYGLGEPCEDVIKDRIRALAVGARDREDHINMLEDKVRNMTEQLERQVELQRSAERRVRQAQNEVADMEDRLRHAEGDAAAADALKDGLRVDKHRYLRFMERLAQTMQMDAISADVGFDINGDAIIARAEDLQRRELDSLSDKSGQIYSLQHKIKTLKDQLESKDLHNDLLRKKIQQLEERIVDRSDLERERDDDTIRARKLEKLVDKYKLQIGEYRQEIRDLKARLMDSSNYRIDTLEASKEIESLEDKVDRLERVRQKQARKIDYLKSDIDTVEGDRMGTHQNADYTVAQLSRELATTKAALDEITRREKQLLDLRQVLARMLGLEVNSLAVPDYEIIARLEKLILANKSLTFTTMTLDSALEDAEDGFKTGYYEAAKRMDDRHRSPQRSKGRARSRSMSPSRRRDPRQY